MSDIRRVRSDTTRATTMSQEAVLEARDMLETLMKREHRGPSDTWTAARDRTAMRIGLEPCQAKRLWQRWQDMKDVSGGVYRALRNAYESQCEHNERMAAHHRAVREAIEDGSTDKIERATALAVAAKASRSKAQAPDRARP